MNPAPNPRDPETQGEILWLHRGRIEGAAVTFLVLLLGGAAMIFTWPGGEMDLCTRRCALTGSPVSHVDLFRPDRCWCRDPADHLLFQPPHLPEESP